MVATAKVGALLLTLIAQAPAQERVTRIDFPNDRLTPPESSVYNEGNATDSSRGSRPPSGDVQFIRQQYNQVAASIDTLVRTYGADRISDLVSTPVGRTHHQEEFVLLFWADDEAVIYVNGFPVSRTRLTPTQVEIPGFYLKDENELSAHCWDTDGVESGFMAGLYMRDGGRLRPVLTTGESWRNRHGELAKEFFYAHTQPDIPGARIIWGAQLFGEVRLSATFGSADLVAAGGAMPVQAPEFRSRPMEFNDAISKLVSLQEKRQELADKLAVRSSADSPEIRYSRFFSTRLSFTLGSAGPLAEETNMTTASRTLQWARNLSAEDRELVFRPPRELKGLSHATSALVEPGERQGRGEWEEDRRRDYVAPPERAGSAPGSAISYRDREAAQGRSVGFDWRLVAITLALGIHAAITGRSWWRLYRADWKLKRQVQWRVAP